MIEGVKLIELNELGLSVSSSFQFLNTLCFRSQYQRVLHRWQCNQVTQPIVSLDAIQVVDDPTHWHGTMCFFPDQDMLKNISVVHSTGMVWSINLDISVWSYYPSPFPAVMLFPFAWYVTVGLGQFIGTGQTVGSSVATRLPAVCARMPMLFPISLAALFRVTHSFIVAQLHLVYKLRRWIEFHQI